MWGLRPHGPRWPHAGAEPPHPQPQGATSPPAPGRRPHGSRAPAPRGPQANAPTGTRLATHPKCGAQGATNAQPRQHLQQETRDEAPTHDPDYTPQTRRHPQPATHAAPPTGPGAGPRGAAEPGGPRSRGARPQGGKGGRGRSHRSGGRGRSHRSGRDRALGSNRLEQPHGHPHGEHRRAAVGDERQR